MHIKRKTIPNFWPVKKTGTKYIAVADHNKNSAMPLIIALRDVLKIVKNKKELKELLYNKKVIINNKVINETNYPISLFDSLVFPTIKKYYRAVLKNKKMDFVEITQKESLVKISKVLNKKVLDSKRIQINLAKGYNLISKEKISTGDFIILDEKNNIQKIIKLEKGSEIIVTKGKYAGVEGKIKEIYQEGENKLALIKTDSGDLKLNINTIYAKL